MKHFTHKCVWVFLLAVFVIVQPLTGQDATQYAEKIKIFEEYVKKQMEIDRLPGLSIGFMKDDYVWAKGFGYADLENKTPATAKSAYRLASVTKTMTAVAVLQLVEKGKINLEAEVQTYVPYFPRKKWPISVRQLLGHLAGISHYRGRDELHIKEHKDTREAIAIFENFDLMAKPGTKYSYTSYGYNLLGAVIEGAEKQSYRDYMRENIWEPLGMTDTRMDDPNELIPNRVRGYRLINGEVKHSEFIDISSRFAAGGTRSTVIDLLKFARGLSSNKALSQESIDEMFTSMSTVDGRLTNYGMGWAVSPVNGHFVVTHSGGQAETRTRLFYLPTENFAIAVGCNFEDANPNTYALRLFELIFDEPVAISVYTGDNVEDNLLFGMQGTFNYGLGHFDRYQKPATTNQDELAEAFAYFNKFVNPEAFLKDPKETAKKISDGRHPVVGQPFVKIGSFMAKKLEEKFGLERISTYHKMGGIRFFQDYVELYKSESDYPQEFKLSRQLEDRLGQWHRDWMKTCNEYTRRLHIAPYSDLEEIGKELKNLYSGAKVYPNFNQELAEAARYLALNSAREKAFQAVNLACELYPKSGVPLVNLAHTYIYFGEQNKAREFYKKAQKEEVGADAVNPGSLYRFAFALAEVKKLDEAMKLLTIATELYPSEARLYDGIGEIYLLKAQNYYQKALEVDPNFQHARERLKKIQ